MAGRGRGVLSLEAYEAGVRAGERGVMGRAITLLESTRAEHEVLAQALLQRLMPATGGALRVGITGVPGAGKSTFIEALGTMLTGQGHRVAVLAVDPSSARSGGSILGDKTRMARLSVDPRAFIRPSPSSCTLGGVATKTRETMLLCEAAGYDVVLVETVGVGQSETMVAGMTDVFLMLMLTGAGDELQGIKRGVMEMADIAVINKADGDNVVPAQAAAQQVAGALRMLHGSGSAWEVPVLTCSSLSGEGVAAVWSMVQHYREVHQANGAWAARRRAQDRRWMWDLVEEGLRRELHARRAGAAAAAAAEVAVTEGREPAPLAAARVLRAFKEALVAGAMGGGDEG